MLAIGRIFLIFVLRLSGTHWLFNFLFLFLCKAFRTFSKSSGEYIPASSMQARTDFRDVKILPSGERNTCFSRSDQKWVLVFQPTGKVELQIFQPTSDVLGFGVFGAFLS